MPRRASSPAPPREALPDLPPSLTPTAHLSPSDDLIGVEIGSLDGDVDASHSRVTESRLAGVSVGRLDLTGGVLSDVAVDDVRAIVIAARDAVWRNVAITGGRLGTLDAVRAQWDAVTLRGVRIDYVSLSSATVEDVRFADCEIGTLDVPEGRLRRVAFENCRVDEVDTRGLRSEDLDLRGLEALGFTDPRGLAGAWLSSPQIEMHSAALARALGITVAD